jgi:hypothetical protein
VSRTGALIIAGALLGAMAILSSGCPEEATGGDAGELGDGGEPGLEDGGVDYAFCPTRIDVYGGAAVSFAGCGGVDVPLGADAGAGLSGGDAGYLQTLAGRLMARLAEDPELVARFGASWMVRSCARAGATLGTFSNAVPPGECSAGGATGSTLAVCADQPAPLVLFSADNETDRCHGGGTDSNAPEEDQVGYADHWRFRLDRFLDAHGTAAFVMVSPQHEWHGQPGTEDASGCGWKRPEWNATGAAAWRAQNRSDRHVRMAGTLQGTFVGHHPCCSALGRSCAEDWFSTGAGGDGWVQFGCAGADALVDFWFAEVKAFLMNNRFTCP